MSFTYYQCDWIHPENDEPVMIYYEVDDAGVVPRLIDVFADGRRQCMSVTDFSGQKYKTASITSLVEGSFYDGVAGLLDGTFFEEGQDRISLTVIGAEIFEMEWQSHRPSSAH